MKLTLIVLISFLFIFRLFGQEISIEYIKSNHRSSEIGELIGFLQKGNEASLKEREKIKEKIRAKYFGIDDLEVKITAYWIHSHYCFLLNEKSEANISLEQGYSILIDNPELKKTHLGVLMMSQYGRILAESGKLDLLVEACTFGKELRPLSSGLLFHNYNLIASAYLSREDFSGAHKYYAKALTYGRMHGKLYHSSGYNNLGLLYYQQKKYDSALNYFDKAMKILDTSDVDQYVFYANVEENIANVYLYTDSVSKAIELLKKVSEIRRSSKRKVDSIDAIMSDVRLLEVYCAKKKHNAATRMIFDLDKYYDANELVRLDYSNRTFGKYLRTKEYFYANTKDYENYNLAVKDRERFFTEKYTHEMDVFKSTILGYSKVQYESLQKENELIEKLAVEEELLNSEKNSFYVSVILLLIALVFVLFLFLRLRKSKQKKLRLRTTISDLKNEKLQRSLDSKHKDLINVLVDNDMRSNFQKEILADIQSVQLLNQVSDKTVLNSIVLKIKSQIILEERLNVLKSDLSKLNSNFEQKLIEQYPSLTKTEREICSYIRLNLSIKEIAKIRGGSMGAIKMTRSRIRSKLNLDQNTELNKYIQSL